MIGSRTITWQEIWRIKGKGNFTTCFEVLRGFWTWEDLAFHLFIFGKMKGGVISVK